MSNNEFYHEALVRRIRDRDDCDDDLRGACDEIENCYEAISRLEAEIDRMCLTDEEREAVAEALRGVDMEIPIENRFCDHAKQIRRAAAWLRQLADWWDYRAAVLERKVRTK